jgi:NDP-sugar pyrophosphorylase family protein
MNDRPLPPLALLAGGLSTRLRSITTTIPKSMVSVAGVPFIDHQLRLLVRQGIRKVVLCIGYLGEQIESHVGDGARFGCSVFYARDGITLRGTGGAIRNALPLLGDHFFVMYGDSYLPIDFKLVYDGFLSSAMPGLMTVFRNENRWDKSNVAYDQGRILAYDKVNRTPDMQYIDYGLGILSTESFVPWMQTETFDLAAVYSALVRVRRLCGFETLNRFYEIGTPDGLHETDQMLSNIC